MKILPIKKQTIISNLSQEHIITILKNHSEPYHPYLFNYKKKNEFTLFIGEIQDKNFTFYHYINYRNSFNPEIKGSIKSYSNIQNIIELEFRIRKEIQIFITAFYIGITSFFILTFSIFIYDLFHNKLQIGFVIPLFMLVFLYFLIKLGMNTEINKALKDFKKILHIRE